MRYTVKCDDCRVTISETDSFGKSVAGGLCDACRSQRAVVRRLDAIESAS